MYVFVYSIFNSREGSFNDGITCDSDAGTHLILALSLSSQVFPGVSICSTALESSQATALDTWYP